MNSFRHQQKYGIFFQKCSPFSTTRKSTDCSYHCSNGISASLYSISFGFCISLWMNGWMNEWMDGWSHRHVSRQCWRSGPPPIPSRIRRWCRSRKFSTFLTNSAFFVSFSGKILWFSGPSLSYLLISFSSCSYSSPEWGGGNNRREGWVGGGYEVRGTKRYSKCGNF